MGLDNFLIPVLGGYLLLIRWTYTKYQTERLTSYHLVFNSTVIGILLWFIASLVVRLGEWLVPNAITGIDNFLPHFITFDQMLCVFLGYIFPFAANWAVSDERRTRSLIEQYGDDMEKLIDEAVREIQLVEVTTKTRKVYVDIPLESNLLSRKDSGVVLIPFASGYRSEATMELFFTTWYADVISEALQQNELLDELEMRVALPFQQLASVRKFVPETYLRFMNELEDTL